MIIFRTDGNPQIGAGHIMRCLSIANKAKDFGETCLFIVSSDHFKNIITDSGHKIENLKSDYSRMEPEDMLPALDVYRPSAVFVDSYFVTEKYLLALHEKCSDIETELVYMDDRCIIPYSCDFLVNYNVFARLDVYEKLYNATEQPTFLLGSLYAPLRKEFQNSDVRTVLQQAVNIFVSTGGADPEHLTVDMIEKASKATQYTFHFVVGMMNPDRTRIMKMSEKYKNIIVHENVKRMDELMRSCDVAISAAGSTLYELCATQTPSITYVLADNQIPAAEEFDFLGIMKNCGDIRTLGNKALANKLVDEAVNLAENYGDRKCMSSLMRTVADGNGAERILKKVLR